jgi:hypothetical protein
MHWVLFLMAMTSGNDNLLVNADFRQEITGWEIHPAGTRAELISVEDRTLLRIQAGAEESVEWRQVYQRVPAEAGALFEALTEARGENIANGVGAYFSLAFYDAEGKRLAYQDARAPDALPGWSLLRAHAKAPEGAAEARLVLILHGHGEAYFRAPVLNRLPQQDTAPPEGAVTIQVTRRKVCDALIGFGAEDDGWFYNRENAAKGVDEAAIALRERRIEWMQPDYVRMFFWYNDWNPSLDAETFTWDSDNMISHYRTLDVYQRLGTRVNVTGVEWAVKAPWANPEVLARAIGALFEHLIVTRGYTCIQDWTLSNEPNLFFAGQGQTFETFVLLHRLVREEFDRRGLDINIVGSDDGDGEAWYRHCVEDPEYYELCDLFASHFYVKQEGLPFLRSLFEDRIAPLAAHTPQKPFIVAEFGLQDHRFKPPDINPYMEEFGYALQTQACYIDGLNAGVAGFVIWCLHEMYYPGGKTPMRFGLWNFGDRGWSVRPVYHAVAAFTRNTRAGDRVYRCESTHPHTIRAVRVGDTLFWVNLSDRETPVRLRGFRPAWMHIYTEDSLEGDRECGLRQPLRRNAFTAPPKSFGYIGRQTTPHRPN